MASPKLINNPRLSPAVLRYDNMFY